MKLKYTVQINSTPDIVFSWLGDPERAKIWQENIGETQVLHQTDNMIGTIFKETVEEGGQGVEMKGMVTDYRQDEALAMHLESKYHKVDVAYHLEGTGEGTRLTQIADIRFRSFLRISSLVFWPAFKKKITEQMAREYARLKEICEKAGS